MALFFKYGSFVHAAGEALVSSFNVSVERSPRGNPILTKKSMTISGIIDAGSNAELTAKLKELEAAYAKQDQVAGLFHDSGEPTVHYLPNANTLGGVRSSGVSYPSGESIEYVTSRSYSVTLEADYLFEDQVLDFQETLSFTGTCSERWVYLNCLNGPPEKQIVEKVTTQKVTQSGMAMGFRSRPSPPAPLWPESEHKEARQITNTSPKVVLGVLTDYGIQWSYSFESATPLVGSPHVR